MASTVGKKKTFRDIGSEGFLCNVSIRPLLVVLIIISPRTPLERQLHNLLRL